MLGAIISMLVRLYVQTIPTEKQSMDRPLLTARGLEQAMLDVINWAAEYPDISELARLSGLSRPTIYKTREELWDPPMSTLVILAKTRADISGASQG